MHEFFPKIYEIPRTAPARALCVYFAVAKNTVLNLVPRVGSRAARRRFT
jgi:hypothetical protein